MRGHEEHKEVHELVDFVALFYFIKIKRIEKNKKKKKP